MLKDAQTEVYTVPAGGSLPLRITGRFIRCLESDAPLYVAIGEGGGLSYFDAGIARRIPDEKEEFTFVRLYNTTGSDVDCTIGWGFGDIEDNRLTTAATLKVTNALGQKLDVDDADTQTALASILAMMQNSSDQRAQNTDLDGMTYAFSNGTTSTLVTAVANTNGIRIARAFCQNNSGGGSSRLSVDGTDHICYAGAGMSDRIDNLLLPAGVALEIQSAGAGVNAYIWYEVL